MKIMVCSTVDAGRLSGWQVPAALYGWAGLRPYRKPAHPAPALASAPALVALGVVVFVFVFVLAAPGLVALGVVVFVFVLAAPALVALGVVVFVVAPADVAFGVIGVENSLVLLAHDGCSFLIPIPVSTGCTKSIAGFTDNGQAFCREHSCHLPDTQEPGNSLGSEPEESDGSRLAHEPAAVGTGTASGWSPAGI